MKVNTIQRKKAMAGFKEVSGKEKTLNILLNVITHGKQALDSLMLEMGRSVAESIMLIEGEEIAGPDYHPTSPCIQKWAHEDGSVYIGDQKVKVKRPRVRDVVSGEIALKSYQTMRQSGQFSNEVLENILRGVSAQKYEETVAESAKAFGVSPSSISKKVVEVTGQRPREFQERSLASFNPFAIFLDAIHRGQEAFLVALGIDLQGEKMALGFWQGSSENHDICKELFADLESRGLELSKKVLFVTDGGTGIIKALLEQNSYTDARQMLLELEKWLRSKNESAAGSLLEAFQELLTLHRLKMPKLLRKILITTNPIESMFSLVRHAEKNIKHSRGSKMLQRWLGSVLLYCEQQFYKIRGADEISQVIAIIESEQVEKIREVA